MTGIDLQKETLLKLSEAAERLPGRRGGRCCLPTVWRWCLEGCRAKDGTRVYLEYVRVGNTRITSVEALGRFLTRLTEADRRGAQPKPRRRRPAAFSPERQAVIKAAQEDLKAAGLL